MLLISLDAPVPRRRGPPPPDYGGYESFPHEHMPRDPYGGRGAEGRYPSMHEAVGHNYVKYLTFMFFVNENLTVH